MKTVSTAELRKNIAKVLQRVLRRKSTIAITRYGRVVAKIVSVSK